MIQNGGNIFEILGEIISKINTVNQKIKIMEKDITEIKNLFGLREKK